MRGKRFTAGLLAAGLVVAGAASASAEVDKKTSVSGAGATFPLNIIEQWKADFKKSAGVTINYTGVGSGAGRSQLINGTVDFAGSDTPASASDTAALKAKYGNFVNLTEISGGIALGYNLPGNPSLKLSPPTIAGIFSGEITNWNSGRIANDGNSGLPNLPIQAFVRSDSSGTSANFTGFLNAAAKSSWRYGATSQFPTDNGQIAKSGNDGVANGVVAASGGIGYMEVSFAKERGLSTASVRNSGDQFVQPTTKAVTDAVADGVVNADGTVNMDPAWTTGTSGAYPLVAVTYLLIPTNMNEQLGTNLKAWIYYILHAGQDRAAPLNYAPLPANMIAAAMANLDKVPGDDPRPNAGPTTTQPGTPTTKPTGTTAKKVSFQASAKKVATLAKAKSLRATLAKKGFTGFVVEREAKNRFDVEKPQSNHGQAQALVNRLKKAGFHSATVDRP